MENEEYTYKDQKYVVVREVLVKNQITRRWEEAVMYVTGSSNNVFVREKQDFYTKFKKLE